MEAPRWVPNESLWEPNESLWEPAWRAPTERKAGPAGVARMGGSYGQGADTPFGVGEALVGAAACGG